jgi:diguanylate cyclase (GGDEF)-like protein
MVEAAHPDRPGEVSAITGPARTRSRAWLVAVTGFVAVFGYFLLPTAGAKDIAYVAIGAVSSLLMIVGLKVNRPAQSLSWWLLIAGNVTSTVGDGLENVVYGMVLHRPVPFPSVADLFYLAAYPCIFLGLVGVCRTSGDGRRENFNDATVVALAAMAVSWHFVMGSTLHRSDLSAFGKAVLLAYPLMDIGLLFVMVRSLVFGSARLTFHRILAVALTSTLVADSAYDYIVQHAGYSTGNVIDAGWLLNYVLMAFAALHPSVAATVPARPFDPASPRRVPILALAGFVGPAILLANNVTGLHGDTAVIAVTSPVITALVVLRMSWLLQGIRAQSLKAERDALHLAEALEARERLESDLRHQAFHDPLTGLANRALLYERVQEALPEAAASRDLVSLCFCDLDGFKTVNDSLGHKAGDELLTVVSHRLNSLVRPGDTVARLGGDEFAVLLEGVDSPATATRIADRIVAAMREPIQIGDHQITLSVSVGLSFADPSKSTEQLLSEADVAMYEAKAKGRSRWESFEVSMRSRSLERLELANGFRGALERGEFALVYQPQFSLPDAGLEGFEALLRWRHPTRGVVPPNRFVPLAEETGFIIPLGRWVLERACEQAASWAADMDPAGSLTMAVNLSGRQMQDPGLCDDVRTALSLTGLAAERLVLEVTETSLLDDSEDTSAVLAGLKDIGVRLGLDDFGTGYSSLSYLRRLPLDVLKIDKSFVDPLVADGAQEEALVSTIVDFAHVLGLRTVAEGVETEGQLAKLNRLGCASVQGFHLSRPLTAGDAAELISRHLGAGLGCPVSDPN